jgi:hypothetical protein
MAGQACLAAAQQIASQPTFCNSVTGGMSVSAPACQNVFSKGSGAAGPGQACTTSADCAAPAMGTATCNLQTVVVDGGGSMLSGKCVQLVRGQAGQMCAGTMTGNGSSFFGLNGSQTTENICYTADGLHCDSMTHVCTALGVAGSSCNFDEDCIATDFCATGKCAARVAVGATCPANGGFGGGGCVAMAYCDSQTMTCKPTLGTGQTCTVSAECQSGQCTNGKCTSSSIGLALLCGG